MRRIRFGRAVLAGGILLVSVGVLSGLAGARGKAKPAAGAYDQLPMEKLIKSLSAYGMVELLQALEQQLPADDPSFQALATRARIRIGLANAMAEPRDRNRLLDQAIGLLTKAVERAAKEAKTDAEKFEALRLRLELAVTSGIRRIEDPHVVRLRYLQGSNLDKQVIARYTKKAVDVLDVLKEDIADTLTYWRPDLEKLMTVVPQLEDLEDTVRYKAGWIRLYRIMSLPAGPEKSRLCREAVAEMRPFAEGDADTGVKYWSRLVIGMARRELAQHDEAAKALDSAAVPRAGTTVRLRAWFERARNRIEQGAYAQAEKAIQEFQTGAAALVGAERRAMIDVRAVMLTNYLYETQAAAEKDPQKVDVLKRKAQEALLSFVGQYGDRPELVRAFLDIIATKYADLTDLEGASSLVLLARAYAKIGEKDYDAAETLLRTVLTHRDLADARIAASIEPTVLWKLAFLMNDRKRNVRAARYFAALARRYPKHELAPRAARFAVRSLYGAIRERRAKGEVITTNLRVEFIRALEILLTGRGKEQGIPKWNFDLGSQCIGVAETAETDVVRFYWQSRAIEAFERVPPGLLEYMEARHSALGLRTQVVLTADALAKLLQPDNADTKKHLRAFARELVGYEQAGSVEASAPAGGAPGGSGRAEPASQPSPQSAAGDVEKRAGQIAQDLARRLMTYSDPMALITRLKSYSTEAAKESKDLRDEAPAAPNAEEKAQKQAIAAELWEWAAQADYQAAVIRYEQLPKARKDPKAKEQARREALDRMQQLRIKWADTPVLRQAYEFEIRKRVEQGQTDQAIQLMREFKGKYPDQADQLIKLVVQQIQGRVDELKRSPARAAELRDYQQAYAGFARDLYGAVQGLPIATAKLDQMQKDLEALAAKKDVAAVRKLAEAYPQLVAEHRAQVGEIKVAAELERVVAEVGRAATPQAEAKLLPTLSAYLAAAYDALRDVIRERYAVHQMYGDALHELGQKEAAQQNVSGARKAYGEALKVFQQCRAADDERRKMQAGWLEEDILPRINLIQGRAKSISDCKRLVEEFKAGLVRRGLDPERSDDLNTVLFAYEFLQRSRNREQELQRLPRVRQKLTEAWTNLLERLKNSLRIDSDNIVGLARSHWGLKQYPEALKLYLRYVNGIRPTERAAARAFWRGQLERCECTLAGFRDKAEAMRNLQILIRQLQLIDRKMGGLAPEFTRIMREAGAAALKAATTR